MSAGPQSNPSTFSVLSRGAVPAVALLFAIGLGVTYMQLSRNHDILIERTAVQHAAVYSDTLDKFRELYASEVVETARKSDLRITHDYLTEPNAIPLPITLSRKFEEDPPTGVTTKMYSPFPFEFPGIKPEGGLRDAFGRDAWKNLNEDPKTPYYRIEDYKGVRTLRYAIAEQMKDQCVSCHNDYVGSPKTDWKTGDVRGVLEVNYPLDQAASLAESSIWETLGTLTPMMMLALVLLGMTTRKDRQHMEALEKRVRAQQQAQKAQAENADLRTEIDQQRSELLDSRLELLGNEERLFQVLESMPLGVLLVDSAGETKYANDSSVGLLGESRVFDGPWTDLSAHADSSFFYPGTDDAFPTVDLPSSKALRGEPADAMHLEMVRDGTRMPVLVSGAPIYDAANQVTFAIVALQDISEEQRLEQQVRQAQRMHAVGRLAGGVAHDFNNVLTAINGFATYAMEDLEQTDTAYGDLQQVIQSTKRGASLTRQLLAFSRHHSINPQVIGPNAAVTSIEQMLTRLLGEDIDLRTDLAEPMPNIRIGEGALDQILVNFAVNARDAMPSGGELSITTSSVDLDDVYMRRYAMDLPAGEYVRISVTDTGEGMEETTRRHMFDPFFTTKGPGKGTGLGLSTCWGIARQAGGHIAVESEIGRGTTLHVYLPAIHEDATENSLGGIRTGEHREVTIAVVEDDAQTRAVVVRRLKRAGCNVIEAVDGEDAMETLRLMAPGTVDLLLTDVVMPRMNGTELVRKISKSHPNMKVLYMSGYTDDTLLHDGVTDVHLLQKPFDPEELAQKVWDVLDSPTSSQPAAS